MYRSVEAPTRVDPAMPEERPTGALAREWVTRAPWPGLWLAAGSFLLILCWVAAIAPLDAPDEPAHLQAIMQVRTQQILPEVHYGFRTPTGQPYGYTADPATQNYIRARRRGTWVLIPYESMQAPLFYLAAGIVALPWPADPQTVLYLGRLVAALLGAATVFCCWAAVRELLPDAPALAAVAAAFVALVPQFGFNSASAANDSAFNCLAAAAFYCWFRALRRPAWDPWLLRSGAVVGLAILAKVSGATLLAGLGLLVLFRACGAGGGWGARLGRALRLGATAGAGVLVVCGWWLLRNAIVYHDPTGSRDAFRFYHGRFQPLDLSSATSPVGRAAFFQQTWESLWGRFGWMSIRLPDALYLGTGILCLLLLGLGGVAAARALRRARPGDPGPVAVWQAAALMGAVALAVAAGYLQYNLAVNFQAQGRYFFALLLPAALLLTGGLAALAPRRGPGRLVLVLPLAWLGLLNVVGLYLTAGVGR